MSEEKTKTEGAKENLHAAMDRLQRTTSTGQAEQALADKVVARGVVAISLQVDELIDAINHMHTTLSIMDQRQRENGQ